MLYRCDCADFPLFSYVEQMSESNSEVVKTESINIE